jgi:hypothetical protein
VAAVAPLAGGRRGLASSDVLEEPHTRVDLVEETPNRSKRSRLDSWKEIAEHVGRDVRTAIRWEHERGLPVHRVPGGKRGSVFAFTDEIDRWLLRSGGAPNGEGKGRVGPEGGGDEAARPARPARVPWWRRRAAALAAVPVLALSGLTLQAGLSKARPAAEPVAAVSLDGTALVARDRDRRALWSHDFGREVFGREDSRMGQVPSIFATDDLDGDGRPDLVVSVTFGRAAHAPGRDELFAFSSVGRVLWSRRLDQTLRFGGGSFGPPWRNAGRPIPIGGPQVAVFDVDGQKRIAWAQSHQTWWPAILSVLDADGHALGEWVHSGVIVSVVATQTPEGPRLLAGGVSNSRAAGFLAVLDGRRVEGSGPEDPGSPFACLSCGPGSPLRYFTFEPSELSRAISPYNHLHEIRSDDTGVEVRTQESEASSPFVVQAVARFSPAFTLEHVAWSSSWAARHRELERAGKLDHSAEDCPERERRPRVREWTADRGWRDAGPEPARVASTSR